MNFNRKTTDLKTLHHQKINPYHFLSPNATVWIKMNQPDESLCVFKKGLVISLDPLKNYVKVRVLEAPQNPVPNLKNRVYEEYPFKDVFKVNSLYRPQGYDDLTRMVVINEAEIIYNFRTRFSQSLHYNYINTFLVFLNGNSIPAGLFSRTNISFYKKMLHDHDSLSSKDFLPHIYGEIGEAIKSLKQRKSQAIIFQGETNSGKSKNFWKAVEFLSLLNKDAKESRALGDFFDLSDSMHFDIYEELFYACNFLIDAFTCVRTPECEMSSRALKMFSFLIDKSTFRLSGVSINTEFLENQRVSNRNPTDSNFLIFYYLIYSLDSSESHLRKELKLKKKLPEEFEILKVKESEKLPQMNPNKDMYKQVTDSLTMIGLNDEEIKVCFKTLLAVVFLGEKNSPETNKYIEELLGTSLISGILENENSRRFIMNWLYKKVFKWIVQKIKEAFLIQINPGKTLIENIEFFNLHLRGESGNSQYAALHLLDPCGVQSGKAGGLSEFLNNYFFEKLQQFYLKESFKDEEVNFLQEGLIKSCEFIDFKDNLPIIELIEKPHFGVFPFFEEVSRKIKEKSSFLEEKSLEEIMAHDGNDVFFTGKMTKKIRSFVIIHSFSEIYYSIDAILDEIKQKSTKEDVVCELKNSFSPSTVPNNKLFSLFMNNSKLNSTKPNLNFIQKFQIRADAILSTLSPCEKRFVFCIDCENKQTDSNKKPLFDSQFCLSQAQIFEFQNLIYRYKEEFIHKIEYPKFYQEFKDLLTNSNDVFMKDKILDHRFLSEKVIQTVYPEAVDSKILFGKSKIYLKSEIYQKLLAKKALTVNKRNQSKQVRFFSSPHFRMNLKLSVHGLKQVMKVIIEFQKRFRARMIRKKFLRKKKALTQLMAFQEKVILKENFKKYRARVICLTLKNQRLKKTIRLMQISRNSFVRGYFSRYRENVQLEKIYSTKKGTLIEPRSPSKQRPSRIIQADVILKQLSLEKQDSKKNSLSMTQPPVFQREELSLGKLLKNKLLKSLETKSLFNRLINKKTNESPISSISNTSFSLDESSSLEQQGLIFQEELKHQEVSSIIEKSELEEMLTSDDLERKRRKCVTAKSFLEYENKSTKSWLEEFLEYKAKKEPLELELEQIPSSNDLYLDFELLDKRFIEELKREYFEETWKRIIIERTVWGQKQKYTKLMSFQNKMLDNPLLDLPSKFKDLAKRMFKYILQYGEDRKCKFPKQVQLNKLIILLLGEGNAAFLQDEVYLQILKQLSNNPNPSSIKHLMNLLAIISSLIPPSSNLLMSVLNFLYLKASLNMIFNEELTKKCKYIFVRVSKIFEIGARKHVPMESEIISIENSRQILYPVFFLTGEHVLIGCESYTSVRDMRVLFLGKFKLNPSRLANLGIYYVCRVEKENSFSTEEEGFLDDKSKIMDILARWESIKKINQKSDFSFFSRVFVKIRACFEYGEIMSNDDITLIYIQTVHEFLNDKFQLTEKEILNLASSKMAVDYGDFSEEKVRFLKINIQDYVPRSKLESYPPQVWVDRILVNYLTLKTYSKTGAKQLFMSHLKKFEHFNAHVFQGRLFVADGPLEICTGSEGAVKAIIFKAMEMAIGDDANRIGEKIKYDEIVKWGRIQKKGVFFEKLEQEGNKVFNFINEKYKEVEFLLKFYCKSNIKI